MKLSKLEKAELKTRGLDNAKIVYGPVPVTTTGDDNPWKESIFDEMEED